MVYPERDADATNARSDVHLDPFAWPIVSAKGDRKILDISILIGKIYVYRGG